MVSWAVLLQSPPSSAELTSRCDPPTAGTLNVVVELLLRLVLCTEAGKLWFGARWWDNTTRWWCGRVGLAVRCLHVLCPQVFSVLKMVHHSSWGSGVVLAAKILLGSQVYSLMLFLEQTWAFKPKCLCPGYVLLRGKTHAQEGSPQPRGRGLLCRPSFKSQRSHNPLWKILMRVWAHDIWICLW